MNAPHEPNETAHGLGVSGAAGGNHSLPGEAGIPNIEQRARQPTSKKGLLAVGLLVLSIIAVAAFGIARFSGTGRKADDAEAKLTSNRPAAATAEPRKLEVPVSRAASAAAATASAPAPRIPALVPAPEEFAEPIGVRRTGQTAPSSTTAKVTPPEDAPVMLVSSRPGTAAASSAPRATRPETRDPQDSRTGAPVADPLDQTRENLEAYQRQLQGLLDSLTRSTTAALGSSSAVPSMGAVPVDLPPNVAVPPLGGRTAPGGLFGGTLQGSATPRVAATLLGYRSLTLPKGTAFTCALKTKVISAVSGLVGCQVQRNVYSDDGRVLLIERGSHLDGEYRIASMRPGTVRIPVLWTRIRTPHGVTVDVDSPGTGQLGESGIDGYVDNRWGERIGAAMLLSLIDDSVKLIIQNQANDSNADTIVLPSTTGNTSKLAEKVLESTINIPPLIYRNQGGIVGIYVARDVDFSSVYELRLTGLEAKPEAKP